MALTVTSWLLTLSAYIVDSSAAVRLRICAEAKPLLDVAVIAPADFIVTFTAELASVIVMSVPKGALSLIRFSVPVAFVALIKLILPTLVTSIFPFKALKSRSVTSPLLVTATFLSAEAAVISALSALLIIMSWVAVDELNVTLFPLAFTSRSLVEPVVDKVVSAEISKFISLSAWPATFTVEKCEPTEMGTPTFVKSSVFIREFELVFSKVTVSLPVMFTKFTSNS